MESINQTIRENNRRFEQKKFSIPSFNQRKLAKLIRARNNKAALNTEIVLPKDNYQSFSCKKKNDSVLMKQSFDHSAINRLSLKKHSVDLSSFNKSLNRTVARSLKTDDIPGAVKKQVNVQNPKDIMTTNDIPGSRPSKFRHRIFNQKKPITNAKYKNTFDEFGSRKLENRYLYIEVSKKGDPLAGSKERRKNMLSIPKMSDSTYMPRKLGNLRLDRRYYNGIYKNKSNVGEVLREARNEINHSLMTNHSMNLSMHQSPRNSDKRSSSKAVIERDHLQTKPLQKVSSQEHIAENPHSISLNHDFSDQFVQNSNDKITKKFSLVNPRLSNPNLHKSVRYKEPVGYYQANFLSQL
ncbi:unnamed protein product [Moneuplotes crassus]|uniref:Uncharacterized protein n=1 Tax=Euplotes crassus TaxID=5936 RepID=A0AAD2CYR1_EUPCR|nr:unnamed protein product [Moneuplotes crassus]